MRFLLKWSIITILVVTTVSFECPKGEFCSPCKKTAGVIQQSCRAPTDPPESMFSIQYESIESLVIFCKNNPSWSTFHLGEEVKSSYVEQIGFTGCQLPDNKTLSQVVRQVLKEDTDSLSFQSSGNLTGKLHRETFRNFEYISGLSLSSNGLSAVPADLLYDLVNLKELDLGENALSELPADFLDLPSLEHVYLAENQLERLDRGLFKKLKNLKSLNLKYNSLTHLGPTVFEDLESLTDLDMGFNDLEELPSGIFSKMEALEVIDLSGNDFTDEGIPGDLFLNNSHLESVTLVRNTRSLKTLPGRLFGGLRNLKSVQLDNNGFLSVPDDLFARASNLRNVSLSGGRLAEIPEDLFRDCKHVQSISFADNKITHIPMKMFNTLTYLEILNMEGNRLTTFSNKIFDTMVSLKVLNLAWNRIETIQQESECATLNYIYFDDDSLDPGAGAYMTVHDRAGAEAPFCARLIEKVLLTGNKLEALPRGWLHSQKLEVLAIDHNRIKNIPIDDLRYYTHDLQIFYDNNEIETITFSDKPGFKFHTSNIKLWINNNPINCDCRLHDFVRFLDGQYGKDFDNSLTFEMKGLTCVEPTDLNGTRVDRLSRMSLKCPVHNLASENTTCPGNCHCWKRPEGRGYLIDCSYRNLTNAPESLQSPEGYHIELDLTGNLIRKMPSIMQKGYQDVTKLTLTDNMISTVNLDSLFENLEVLALNSNNLTKLGTDVLNFWSNSSRLTDLKLHDNPWTCDCDTLDFLRFIQAKIPKIPGLQKITCVSTNHPSNSSLPIFRLTPEDICPVSTGFIIVIGSAVAILGIFIGSIAAIYYRYKHEIKVYLYAKQWCLWLVTEDELDKDKEYDAFVSFSHLDEPFVTTILLPTLEGGPRPLHLCVHYRNWIPGESIPTQIIQSVEDSRRTIVVLSKNFLESVWSRIEFRTAHQQALSEGRARVIIILYEDIGPMDNLDAELRTYITTNTFVKWKDPWFWEKLMYALPHSDLLGKKRKHDIVELSNSRIHIFDQKNVSP